MWVRVPVEMTLRYQNLLIAPIGINPPIEQIQEHTLQEKNHNEEANDMDVLDDTATLVEKPRRKPWYQKIPQEWGGSHS